MAIESNMVTITREADEDLSTKQFYLVKFTGVSKVAVCNTGTDVALGVLQNKPSAGQGATICIFGESKVSSNAALTAANLIASGDDGQATGVTIGTDTTFYVIGRVTKGSGAAGELASAIICGVPFRGA